MEVLQRTANRGSIATGGYEIANSLKFEQDNSEAMTRTATASQGGNRKTWTWSGWIKRTELGRHMYLFSAGGTGFQILGADNIRFSLYYNNTSYYLDLNAKLRDTSAWYHIVGQLDTTQSTAQDRVKVWINGERQTSFSNDSAHNIPQNADVQHLNEATGTSTGWMKICDWYASGRFFSGYAADWHFTDGVANNPTEFGEFDEDSGIWKPKAYTGSYGTNGFYLDFADGADLGDDESGNGNDFSEGNLTSADQATDTPTNNFCTLNGLTPATTSAYTTEGGTTYNGSYSNPEYALMASTFGVSRGKWYWEVKNSGTNGALTGTGAMRYENPNYNNFLSNTDGGIATYYTYGTAANKIYYFDGSAQTNVAYSSFPNAGTGDIISVALDMDNGKIYFAINNTWGNSGNPATSTNPVGLPSGFITGTYTPAATVGSAGTSTAYYNFGGYTEGTISSAETDENGYGTFEYAPPSGYYALCTKNLAEFG